MVIRGLSWFRSVLVKRDNPAKHFITAFVIALVLYVTAYSWIEHRRNRKGPWEIVFSATNDIPHLIVNQPALGITNVTIVFPAVHLETQPTTSRFVDPRTLPAKIAFDRPREVPYQLPFGTCVFMDTTFLPGTVSFTNVFGHDLELLPRVLIIDRHEHSWQTGERIELPPVSRP